jgi:hypothetical protein
VNGKKLGHFRMKSSLNFGLGFLLQKSTELHRESLPDQSSVGSALYRATTYLSHSCEPNTKLEFADKSHNVTLKAVKAYQEGRRAPNELYSTGG